MHRQPVPSLGSSCLCSYNARSFLSGTYRLLSSRLHLLDQQGYLDPSIYPISSCLAPSTPTITPSFAVSNYTHLLTRFHSEGTVLSSELARDSQTTIATQPSPVISIRKQISWARMATSSTWARVLSLAVNWAWLRNICPFLPAWRVRTA